jgi:hypothetical protein
VLLDYAKDRTKKQLQCAITYANCQTWSTKSKR